jgi:hypothetical protein
MFPERHLPYPPERVVRPDRRPLPRASEIRLRVKRAMTQKGA